MGNEARVGNPEVERFLQPCMQIIAGCRRKELKTGHNRKEIAVAL